MGEERHSVVNGASCMQNMIGLYVSGGAAVPVVESGPSPPSSGSSSAGLRVVASSSSGGGEGVLSAIEAGLLLVDFTV